MMKRLAHQALRTLALTLLVACSSSKGPSVPASVPPGTGRIEIQMTGVWEIRNVTVVDASSTSVAPPLANTQIVFENGAIRSIGGFVVSRPDLEAFLGFPLDFYTNAANGRTVLYGLGYNRLAIGGAREVAGLAGGSVDADTISVESFSSLQLDPASDESFVRARYSLVRVASSPVTLAAEDAATVDAGSAGSTAAAERAIAALLGRGLPVAETR